jgi:CRP-like cAMP-binding protein/Na+-translocating ferredoxin:NAD+ oxidoreductase RNF subunit RnfB
MSAATPAGSKTELRQLEQYRDRWSSYDEQSGLVGISDRLAADELRDFELFAEYDDRFLERIASDVSLASWKAGSVLFEQGAYIDLAFCVVEGEVEVFLEGVGDGDAGARPIFDLSRTMVGELPPQAAAGATVLMRRAERPKPTEITFLSTMDFDLPRGAAARLGVGELFGEIGAMSGWPQSVTARTVGPCRLLQIRLPALRLMKRKSKALKERLDALYRERSLTAQLRSTPLFRGLGEPLLEALKESVELVSCEPDGVLVREGEAADALYLVRSGFLKLLERFGEGEIAVSYLSKGMTLGEAELLIDGVDGWRATAVSVEFAELVKLPRDVFDKLLASQPSMAEQLWRTAAERIKEAGATRRDVARADFLQVALDSGLVQGNSILAIDLDRCTRCDDCVRACAATHGGRARFVREGSRVETLLVARSCYHCRDPVCLVGCPTGAIHRTGVGDVVAVDEEICIGCSACAKNCPYDAIVMHDCGESWPPDMVPTGLRGKDRRVASKCDLCYETGHGPACVSNCPQACAYRVGSVEEMQRLLGGRS